jgi:hypothetical protein
MKTTKKWLKLTLVAIVGIFIAYIAVGYIFKETITVTPTKTERVSGRYLVFTSDGVYKDVDDFRFLKFNSSDVYAKLSSSLGRPVKVTVTGFRVPLLSMYKNIIKVDSK